MSNAEHAASPPVAASSQLPASRKPLRPYKTLAPKPTERSESIAGPAPKATSALLLRQRTELPVCVICQRVGCQLASHKTFATLKTPNLSDHLIVQSRYNGPDEAVYKKSYAYRFASFVDTSLASSRINPFIGLPIPESSHPQLHRLLHDCKGIFLSFVVTTSYENKLSNT